MKRFVLVVLYVLGVQAVAMADGLLTSHLPKLGPSDFMTVCKPDLQKLCSGVAPGAAFACIKSQDPKKLSADCAKKVAVSKNPLSDPGKLLGH